MRNDKHSTATFSAAFLGCAARSTDDQNQIHRKKCREHSHQRSRWSEIVQKRTLVGIFLIGVVLSCGYTGRILPSGSTRRGEAADFTDTLFHFAVRIGIRLDLGPDESVQSFVCSGATSIETRMPVTACVVTPFIGEDGLRSLLDF